MSSLINTHSVRFNPESLKNVDFDVQLFSDLSGVVVSQLELTDIYFQTGFIDTDASATADISLSYIYMTELFKINIPFGEFNVNYSTIRFKTTSKGWPSINLSRAVVRSEYPENSTRSSIYKKNKDQTLRKDFLRGLIFQLTGNKRINNLFKNQVEMLNHVDNVCESIQLNILNILKLYEDSGFLDDDDYAKTSPDGISYNLLRDDLPISNTPYANLNPFRILLMSILGQYDADPNDGNDINENIINNGERRQILVQDLKQQMSNFWDEIVTKEFIHQNKSVFFDYDTLKQIYPNCILTKDDTTVNGNTISEYLNDLKIYILDRSNNSIIGGDDYTEVTSLENVSVVYEKEYNFNFFPGDMLKFIIELKPTTDSSKYPAGFNLSAVTSRKYEIVINII